MDCERAREKRGGRGERASRPKEKPRTKRTEIEIKTEKEGRRAKRVPMSKSGRVFIGIRSWRWEAKPLGRRGLGKRVGYASYFSL